jgi:hypothetical protein
MQPLKIATEMHVTWRQEEDTTPNAQQVQHITKPACLLQQSVFSFQLAVSAVVAFACCLHSFEWQMRVSAAPPPFSNTNFDSTTPVSSLFASAAAVLAIATALRLAQSPSPSIGCGSAPLPADFHFSDFLSHTSTNIPTSFSHQAQDASKILRPKSA